APSSLRHQLEDRIARSKRPEQRGGRTGRHGEIALDGELEAVEYAFRISGFSSSGTARNANSLHCRPFLSDTEPLATALRTHCVYPRPATRNCWPFRLRTSTGVEYSRPLRRPRTGSK